MTHRTYHIQGPSLSLSYSDIFIQIEKDAGQFNWSISHDKRQRRVIADGTASTAMTARRAALTAARDYLDEREAEDDRRPCHKDTTRFHELRGE